MSGTITVGVILFIVGFICSLFVVSLLSGPSSEGQPAIYNDALHEAHAKPAAEAGSNAETQGIQAWKGLLADLASESIAADTKKVYAEKLFFNDTLKNIFSADELGQHFASTADLLHSGSVKYLSEMRDENGDYYIRWQMTYSGKKLNNGEPIVTIGMTQLRIDQEGKVIFHQDFWDSTAGVFEHIPLIGGPIQYIRSRM